MNRDEAIRAFALKQVGAPYVYGGTGRLCTPGYRRMQMRQYPRYADMMRVVCPVLCGKRSACTGCPYQGRPCFDCAQLTRFALKEAGLVLPSGATSQWHSGLFIDKRPIDERAARTLCVLFRGDGTRMQHTGLSLGDGRVVDARGHLKGVVIGPFSSYPWTHYALLPDQAEKHNAPSVDERLSSLEGRVDKLEERMQKE